MTIPITIFAFIFGAIFGSFICCQVRRIIAKEHLHGFQKLRQAPSHCESCEQKLHWWEMLPVLSWFCLRGKCRNCHAPIGIAELLAELGLGAVFAITIYSAISGSFSTTLTVFDQVFTAANTTNFTPSLLPALPYFTGVIFFLVLACALTAVFVFDFLTGEIPTHLLTFCIICAILFIGLEWAAAFFVGQFTLGLPLLTIASAVVLSGFYFVLSVVPSRKQAGSEDHTERGSRLVGDGDWLIALPLALILAHPLLAVANLFLANITGALIAIPFMLAHKWRATTRIPFAPLLIAAFFIVFFAKSSILNMFMVL
ncbi:MAG: prepilin peptidase [Candidatus Nomurabacteria bacterium]|jgi:prepilin signal peptidase PulO-like enzyme (type II secretory pathway)|nr:prepilin peptidase [Candidatus Nomurabacteria bacterium]